MMNEIAEAFGLNHYGGVSSAIYYVKNLLETESELEVKINAIINRFDP